MSRPFTVLALLLAAMPCSAAEELTVRSAAPALKIFPSPRLAAVSDAGAALGWGLASFWVNPALLASAAPGQEFSLSHADWGNEITHDTVGASFASGRAGTGLAVSFLGTGVQERRTAAGYPAGEMRSLLAAFHAGHARRLARTVSAGATVHTVVERLDTATWSSASLDLGAHWRTPAEGVAVGISLADAGVPLAGPDRSRYRLPMRLFVGAAWQPASRPVDVGFTVEHAFRDRATALRAGALYRQKLGPLTAEAGAGYRVSNGSAFPSGPSAGAGLSLREWALRYAYVPYGDVGAVTHRLGLEYRRAATAAELALLGAKPAALPLPAPARVYALPGIGSLKLVWDPPRTAMRVVGYHLYRLDPKTRRTQKLTAQPLARTEAGFAKAAAGVEYELSVSAVYAPAAAGGAPVEGALSAPVRVSARKPGDLPHAPKRLSGRSAAGKVELRWLPNEGGDAAGYYVYAAGSESGQFQRITGRPVRQPLFSDPDVAAGTAVYYFVTAVDAKGREGPPSGKLRVVP